MYGCLFLDIICSSKLTVFLELRSIQTRQMIMMSVDKLRAYFFTKWSYCCIVLYCIVLYCIVLYCIVLPWPSTKFLKLSSLISSCQTLKTYRLVPRKTVNFVSRESQFFFSETSRGKYRDSRETKITVSETSVIKWFVIQLSFSWKKKQFEKKAPSTNSNFHYRKFKYRQRPGMCLSSSELYRQMLMINICP